MRRYLTVAMVALVFAAGLFAVAQEACKLAVRDKSGSSVGRIDADGTFRSAGGSTIGSFKKGVVRNSSGSTIGKVDADGVIRDKSGSTIGRVEPDGTLRNASGSTVGRIDPNGIVRNASGASQGRFDGYVPACRHVAAAYLFFFEPLYNH